MHNITTRELLVPNSNECESKNYYFLVTVFRQKKIKIRSTMLGTFEQCWEIEDYSSLNKEAGGKGYLLSPSFYFGVQGKDGQFFSEWRMELWPGRISNEFVGMYLSLLRSNYSEVSAEFRIWFSKNKRSSPPNKFDSFFTFRLLHDLNGRRSGLYMAPQKSLVRDHSHKNKLIVQCEVKITELSGTVLEHVAPLSSLGNLETPYKKLYNDQRLTDFSIKAEKTKFHVHKVVLAAHSAVLAAMLTHNLVENVSSSVMIEDYKASVVKAFIDFIYSNDVDLIHPYAADLLSFAEKYDVKALKTHCEIHLAQELTEANAAQTLLLADMHNGALLMNATLDFMVRKDITKIMEDENWKSITERPSTAQAVINKLAGMVGKQSSASS